MTGDPFTFEDGVPDRDDPDDSILHHALCGQCWTYHAGECV